MHCRRIGYTVLKIQYENKITMYKHMQLDTKTDLCIGYHRTSQEIAGWKIN